MYTQIRDTKGGKQEMGWRRKKEWKSMMKGKVEKKDINKNKWKRIHSHTHKSIELDLYI